MKFIVGDKVTTIKGCRIKGTPGVLIVRKLDQKWKDFDAVVCEKPDGTNRLFLLKNLRPVARGEVDENHDRAITGFWCGEYSPKDADECRDESSTRQVPVDESAGRYVCNNCGKDWGDGTELWYGICRKPENQRDEWKKGTWDCRDPDNPNNTGCRKHAVTWNPEPAACVQKDSEGNALLALIDTIGREQKAKLLKKKAEGWHGWEDPEYERIIEIKLYEHATTAKTKADWVDVANFAAFLWNLAPEDSEDSPSVTNGPEMAQTAHEDTDDEISRLKAENEWLESERLHYKMTADSWELTRQTDCGILEADLTAARERIARYEQDIRSELRSNYPPDTEKRRLDDLSIPSYEELAMLKEEEK